MIQNVGMKIMLCERGKVDPAITEIQFPPSNNIIF